MCERRTRNRAGPGLLVAGCTVAAFLSFAVLAGAQGEPGPIQDNSFLIEEAYNQEPGVIQHIQTWTRPRGSEPWSASFTEEWPVVSQRHQLSVTVPYLEKRDGGSGVGDLALNYRWQALGLSGGSLSFSPRLSVLLATGDEKEDTGAGGAGLQMNLPASLEIGSRVVAHGNAGATWTPSARDGSGAEASTVSWSVGASAVYLAKSRANVLLEAVYERDESVIGAGRTQRASTLLLSPGLRFAIDLPSGLQIVPGVAFPMGVGASAGDRAVFLYLSFEHPLSALSR